MSDTEAQALAGAEPKACVRHFEALTGIARPSLHEEPAIEHVRAWADRHGFAVQQDRAGNMVVRVPASPGRDATAVAPRGPNG